MSLLPEIEDELLRIARDPVEHQIDDVRVRRTRGRAVGRTLVALLLAGGVLVGGLVVVLLDHEGPRHVPAVSELSQGKLLGSGSVNHPLTAGVRVSLAAARAAVDFPVPLPNTTAANPNNLSAVWLDKHYDAVALVFGNGAVSIILNTVKYGNPTKLFSTLAREVSATASLTRIDGHVAFVIEPRTDPNGPNPAWVEFDLNGIDASLVSYRLSTTDLERIAKSLVSHARCASCGTARAKHFPHPTSSIPK